MIRSGPVPLGGDSEEKRDYKSGHVPWGVSGLSHRVGLPVLGPYMEETSPLGWLEDC